MQNFDDLSSKKRRDFLLKEANFSCEKCGFNTRRECGGCILEIDHIDGNHQNNSRENLRVLCPNCHALTPNFRNWGRNNKKTSTRLVKGNKDFAEFRSAKEKDKKDFEQAFVSKIFELFETKEIDFLKFGWLQKVSGILSETPQVVGRRIRRLMPDFYSQHCFYKNKLYITNLHL